MKDDELPHLRRCVELAAESLRAGDEPFGPVLVGQDGTVLAENHKRVASGEHCPMCAAAHARVGLGRILYVASSARLTQWPTEWRVPAPPVRILPVHEIAPGVTAEGPAPEPAEEVRELHRRFHGT